TKGAAAKGSGRSRIIDPARSRDPDGFWAGYQLRVLDREGQVLGSATVATFDRSQGSLSLAAPLAADMAQVNSYELLSSEEAPLVAVRYMLGLALRDKLPPVAVRLGTTRGTNALITRRGARTAMVTTRGFGDI